MKIESSIETRVLEQFAESQPVTLLSTLGIEYTEISLDRIVARMPVTPRVHQPYGILHGGASVALAETVASFGAVLNIDPKAQRAVGLEINANHIRSMKSGAVLGTGIPLHRGTSTQVWEVRITNEENGELVSVSRCTVAILNAPLR